MAVNERFLLIDNKAFFDKMGIYTINNIEDIPSQSAYYLSALILKALMT
jgi:hypothetical protein